MKRSLIAILLSCVWLISTQAQTATEPIRIAFELGASEATFSGTGSQTYVFWASEQQLLNVVSAEAALSVTTPSGNILLVQAPQATPITYFLTETGDYRLQVDVPISTPYTFTLSIRSNTPQGELPDDEPCRWWSVYRICKLRGYLP